MLTLKKFDDFRQTLIRNLNADVYLGNCHKNTTVNSLTAPIYQFDELQRMPVTFYLASSPDHIYGFAHSFNIVPNVSAAEDKSALLMFPLEAGSFIFNGVTLNANQMGLVTSHSGSAYCFQVPPDTRWMMIRFETTSRHLNLISASMMPIEVKDNQLNKIRLIAQSILDSNGFNDNYFEKNKPGLEIVLQLLQELESTAPPLRPQQNQGRSRLPRKHILPFAIKALKNFTQNTGSINSIASTLGVSTRTLNNMFYERVGLAPKQYAMLIKLYALRDILLNKESSSITDAALVLNITDLGRFSARYKSLFGEYPSDTFKR